MKGDKRVDVKAFRKVHGLRPLSFASADELLDILKLTPGAVSPFGLLNDEQKQVEFYLDKSFFENHSLIGCHPNDNTATVWLKGKALQNLIEEHGNTVHIVEV